jgi:uridylate kinase
MASYKRVLIKLSGEALTSSLKSQSSPDFVSIDPISHITHLIKQIVQKGFHVSTVIGGGNIFRGLNGLEAGTDYSPLDRIGMHAMVGSEILTNTTEVDCVYDKDPYKYSECSKI